MNQYHGMLIVLIIAGYAQKEIVGNAFKTFKILKPSWNEAERKRQTNAWDMFDRMRWSDVNS